MTRCPHARGHLLCCARCVQGQIEPPVQRLANRTKRERTRRNPRMWVAVFPDGKTYTFERVSKSTARAALRHMTGKRAPKGTRWEGR